MDSPDGYGTPIPMKCDFVEKTQGGYGNEDGTVEPASFRLSGRLGKSESPQVTVLPVIY